MSICGISGPLASGKSTLVSLLEPQLPINTIFIHDIHDKVYNNMVDSGNFSEFKEISADRDYLLIYYGRVINYYTDMINSYKDYPGLVIIDGTYIDLLIYGMLNLWYHYPTKDLLEGMVHQLLEHRDSIDIIYMTQPDDANYPLTELGRRRYNTSFKRCRRTETYYYDIFRENKRVVSLPETSVLNCDRFVIEDLKSRGLL